MAQRLYPLQDTASSWFVLCGGKDFGLLWSRWLEGLIKGFIAFSSHFASCKNHWLLAGIEPSLSGYQATALPSELIHLPQYRCLQKSKKCYKSPSESSLLSDYHITMSMKTFREYTYLRSSIKIFYGKWVHDEMVGMGWVGDSCLSCAACCHRLVNVDRSLFTRRTWGCT